VKKLGQAPSRTLFFQGFRHLRSEPVPFFHSLSVCRKLRTAHGVCLLQLVQLISVRSLGRMSQEQGASKMEMLIILGVVVVWIAMQMWILPRFGVST
jgi:hypothetical protein